MSVHMRTTVFMECHAMQFCQHVYQTTGHHIPEDQIIICTRLLFTLDLKRM